MKTLKPKAVRPIWQVAKAFAEREVFSGGEAIRSPRGHVIYDHASGRIFSNFGRTVVVGFNLSGGGCLMSEASYAGRPFIERGLAVAKVPVIYARFWCYPDEEAWAQELMEELYHDIERKARLLKGGTREQAVLEWTQLCHQLGFGGLISLPPGTEP